MNITALRRAIFFVTVAVLTWTACTEVALNRYRLLPADSQEAYCVVTSPDGLHVAAAGGYYFNHHNGPGEIWIWNLHSGALEKVYHVSASSLCYLAYSPDGQHLACQDFKGQFGILDLAHGTINDWVQLKLLPNSARGIWMSIDVARNWWAGDEHGPFAWRAPTGFTLIAYNCKRTVAVAISQATSQLVVGRVSDGSVLWRFPCPPDMKLPLIAFSPDGSKLGVGELGGRFRVYDLVHKRLLRTFNFSHKPMHAAAWSADGLLVAAAGYDWLEVRRVSNGRRLWWYDLRLSNV